MKPFLIILDSGPLGLLMHRRGIPIADACRTWVAALVNAGDRVFVPEVADYEVRRELLRLGKIQAIKRLDAFNSDIPGRYLPITTQAMRRAAEFWSESRKRGLPTSDPKELDGDVIVAAQAVTSGLAMADVIVATTNPVHLSRFVKADLWTKI